MTGRQLGGHAGLITGQGHERDSLFPIRNAMEERENQETRKTAKEKKNEEIKRFLVSSNKSVVGPAEICFAKRE